MELLEGLKTRRSVRRYTDELISHELFEEIIDTAKMARHGRIHRRFATY